MDWPEISEVLAIKPITDERKQREWVLSKRKKGKKLEKKPEQSTHTDEKEEGKGKIDIYV